MDKKQNNDEILYLIIQKGLNNIEKGNVRNSKEVKELINNWNKK